jgi:sugar lactone lactonase YvrE
MLREEGPEAVMSRAPKTNLVRVDTDRSVAIAAADIRFPNGTVITPDGGTLIVAETLGSCLTAFDIAEDGTLGNRRVWAQLDGVAPDGICLDAEGCVWVANALQPECLRVREGGEIASRVQTSQPCFACMLGGDRGQTLFMVTAVSSSPSVASASRTGKIEYLEVEVPHAGFP